MLVIVSWYPDHSGEPQVRFRDIRYHHEDGWTALGLLVADIRECTHQNIRVYDVGESVAVLYDSTIPKERQQ